MMVFFEISILTATQHYCVASQKLIKQKVKNKTSPQYVVLLEKGLSVPQYVCTYYQRIRLGQALGVNEYTKDAPTKAQKTKTSMVVRGGVLVGDLLGWGVFSVLGCWCV